MTGHDFTAKPVMPLGAYIVFVRRSAAGYGAQVVAADDLVRAWLPDEQHAAWDAALTVTTDLGDLLEAVNGLIEVAANRPTRAPVS